MNTDKYVFSMKEEHSNGIFSSIEFTLGECRITASNVQYRNGNGALVSRCTTYKPGIPFTANDDLFIDGNGVVTVKKREAKLTFWQKLKKHLSSCCGEYN